MNQMRLDDVVNLNHDDDFIFAVAAGMEDGYMHCALLYKYDDEKIRTLDFWSNQQVRSSQTIGDFGYKDYVYVYYNRDSIIDAQADQIPAICEMIKEKNNRISFGIKFSKTIFDNDGNLILAEGEFGLTCATFVLAILQKAAIILIDLNNWKSRPEDIIWQERVLEYYKSINQNSPQDYTDELIKHYEENIGCFRYRAEEVAASTANIQLPSSFEYCNDFGHRVKEACINGADYYNNMYLI